MHSHRNGIAVISCMFVVAVATSQETSRITVSHHATEQDIEVQKKMVQVRIELLSLHDGLPEGATSSSNFVGRRFGRQEDTQKDDSGNVIYDAAISGETQWLPGNVIKVMLDITENDIKRTETILLEGFEPQILVLHEDPAEGTREVLRVIPIFTLLDHSADRSRCSPQSKNQNEDLPIMRTCWCTMSGMARSSARRVPRRRSRCIAS